MNNIMAFDLTIQLVNRLEKFHSLGYVHGNICPDSIRFDSCDQKRIILCDFYYSRKIFSKKWTSKRTIYRKKIEGNPHFISASACRLEPMRF